KSSNLNESLDILRLDPSLSLPDTKIPQYQRAAADSVMALLRELGRGYQALCSYNCREAINILTSLPPQHYNTGWVLTHIGRAYFELAEYTQAERLFSEVRRIESYRVEGMEIYSTTLWHLRRRRPVCPVQRPDRHGQELSRGLVCSRKLLQSAEGARHRHQVLPESHPGGPRFCVCVHSVGS
ncbi:hypothetical protein PFLUV_G00185210, partial [Perca fluviatilis]